jgi:hypothetical protein
VAQARCVSLQQRTEHVVERLVSEGPSPQDAREEEVVAGVQLSPGGGERGGRFAHVYDCVCVCDCV